MIGTIYQYTAGDLTFSAWCNAVDLTILQSTYHSGNAVLSLNQVSYEGKRIGCY